MRNFRKPCLTNCDKILNVGTLKGDGVLKYNGASCSSMWKIVFYWFW